MRQLKNLVVLLLLIVAFQSHGQQFTENELRVKLDSLSNEYQGLNNKVQLTVSGLQLADLLNTIAIENNLNLIVSPKLNQVVTYNFFDATVSDVFVLLYRKFDIEINFFGSIVSFEKREIEPTPILITPKKKIDVSYNPANKFLSLNLKNDTLLKVAEAISKSSGRNVYLSPEVQQKTVSGFYQNRPFEQVIEMLGKSNDLEPVIDESGDVFFKKLITASNPTNPNIRNNRTSNSSNQVNTLNILKNANGRLDLQVINTPISQIVKESADLLGEYYFLYSEPEGNVTLNLSNYTFQELLDQLFNGTKFGYKQENSVYLIGQEQLEGLRLTELIRLENRTIENVKSSIPTALTQDLTINEFIELNGFVVSGSARRVRELKTFLATIDLVVPMVQIDVMFITSSRVSTVSTGIKAGLGSEPTNTSGDIFPALNVSLGASTLNNILDAINGFGVVNIGQVTSNFYLSLEALESNNIVDVESTPKISTLNGNEASISIGQTTYYQERQVNVQNTVVNQGVIQSTIWKAIEANLSVTIKPFVSSDENVTLEISVEQDDFTGSVAPTAPPNKSTQTFESLVRVKNGELILLGGLEKKSKNDSGEGVPILSRIPILKWFFSSRVKEREKSKLHILIKPTITY